jgi:hypothetical protein
LASELEELAHTERMNYEAARAAAGESARQGERLILWLGGAVLVALAVLFLQFARTVRELLDSVRGTFERTTFRLLDQVPVGIFVLDDQGDPTTRTARPSSFSAQPRNTVRRI